MIIRDSDYVASLVAFRCCCYYVITVIILYIAENKLMIMMMMSLDTPAIRQSDSSSLWRAPQPSIVLPTQQRRYCSIVLRLPLL